MLDFYLEYWLSPNPLLFSMPNQRGARGGKIHGLPVSMFLFHGWTDNLRTGAECTSLYNPNDTVDAEGNEWLAMVITVLHEDEITEIEYKI